jgi:RNA polymerase sigma-70 factor (ECF subfamily)
VRTDRIQGIVGAASGAKPVRAVTEIRFKDRFQNEQHGHLDDPVADRWNAQRSRAAIGLGKLDASDRIGPVAFAAKLLMELHQETPNTAFRRFDVGQCVTIHARGSLGLTVLSPSGLQHIQPRDPIIQGVESESRFLLRFLTQFRSQIRLETRFQARFDTSDVVQQTMLNAFRDFPQFRGMSEEELKAWLRQILAHVLGHERRYHRDTEKRSIDRDVSIDQQLTESSLKLQSILAADDPSPSDRAIRDEDELLLAEVLEKMPADYQQIIILRNLKGLSHEEAAHRLGRNLGATRMLWVRALARLRKEMDRAESR